LLQNKQQACFVVVVINRVMQIQSQVFMYIFKPLEGARNKTLVLYVWRV